MSPGDAPPCQVVETERVQAPFTLSETPTWPVESNCPNSPTKRSPAVTAPSVTVVLVTRLPVTKVVPCTKEDVGPDMWRPAASMPLFIRLGGVVELGVLPPL